MTNRKLFGTDGIRGLAYEFPLDPETVKKIGLSAAHVLKTKKSKGHPVIIGRDTRESGINIVVNLKKGLLSNELDVWDVGVITTPGIAYLVKKYPALTGIVVSASHNPYQYNGIKFFSHQGVKLSDLIEHKIETQIEKYSFNKRTKKAFSKNKVQLKYGLAREYEDFLKSVFPKGSDLKGFTLVIDCANGATYKIAPEVLFSLGAKVVQINVHPNGKNINKDCGSLHPEILSESVKKYGADCGIAFDGDGDRAIFVDEKGTVRDGDYLLAIMSSFFKKKSMLRHNLLVTTVMANLGLFRAMESEGIKVLQTKVGDRYVYEEMLKRGAVLGGEQSGHVILKDHLPTGDGILTALQMLAVMKETNQPLSVLSQKMKKYPQILLNTAVDKKVPIDSLPNTSKIIKNAQNKLNSEGRILVRYSGTENLLRVMIEGTDKKTIASMAKEIVDVAKREISNSYA
ncbi:MAG: phosphoglucosamine mutase [Endomicrobiales bacterium]|nr:phosphoglucosamine mutase [Endomicrobiales bacterium]